MTVKLLTEPYLRFLSLKEAAQAHQNLHLSKYHIVGNHMGLVATKSVVGVSVKRDSNQSRQLQRIARIS